MTSSLFLYWIESAICLLAAWGLYRCFRSRLSLLFRKWYLLPAAGLGLSIPLLDFEMPHAEVSLSHFSEKWAQWVGLFPGGNVQITGMQILSLVYFLVTAVLLFRLGDRLVAEARTPFKTAELLFVEGGIALFWFQPLLFAFRKEWRKVEKALEHGQSARNAGVWQAVGVTIASIGSWLLLFWMFSANQICRAPRWNDLESRSFEWQAGLETPLLRLGSPRQESVSWEWGGYRTHLSALTPDTLTRFPVRMLSPFEFYSICDQDWKWQKDGWPLDPVSMEALAVFPFQTKPLHFLSIQEVKVFLNRQRYATEMTLLLKISDEKNRLWLGVIGISEKERVYGFEDILQQTWGVEMPFLRWRENPHGKPLAELTPHSAYSLVWGGLKLPLDFQANPNVYGAYAVYDLEEFQQLVSGPIRFYLGDSLLSPEAIRVNLSGDFSRRPSDPFGNFKTVRQENGEVFVTMDPGDIRPASTWTIVATLPGGIEINAVNLEIRDTDTPYDPPLRAHNLPRVDTLFTFQLITREDQPSVLRMDTTVDRNRKILDMYRGNGAYRVIHIPGFQTSDRLIQIPGEVISLLRKEEMPLDSIFGGDRLPELPYALLDTMYLEWGALFAAPDSKVYSLEEFRSQQQSPLRLKGGGRNLKIRSFVLYYYLDGKPLHAQWFNPHKVQAWPGDSISAWTRPRTSLFIDQLVVADESGRQFSIPVSYAFHVGKSERDIRWKVVIEQVEAGEAGEPEKVEEEQTLEYRNYRLSDLIAELTLHPKSRMDFRGLEEEPLLNVRLSANGPLPGRAWEFMLDELQKQFRFDFSYERLPRPNWRLHLKDPDLLGKAIYPGGKPPEENIRVIRWDGTHVLTGVTLSELAIHLEGRFDEIVEWFPNAFMNDRFSFSLDCSSLNSVQFQLETEYGIVFQRMDMLWQGMVVRFIR